MQYDEHAWAGEDGYDPRIRERREPLKGMLSLSDEELGALYRTGLELVLDEDDYMLTPTIGSDTARVVIMLDRRFVTLTTPMIDHGVREVLAHTELLHNAKLVWIHLRNGIYPQRQVAIVRALGMDKGTVARSLASLSRLGFARREDGVWLAEVPR
ncbi:helix-turn-helix domain-containing protein [Streptomyces maoxianensis]|uniref:Helix-turn-helix domain-containing protein n=1 Tax=Streptomyces maoxianensis TaxID=1459942 RepID=A0ABV9G9X9_9ACTN